MGLFRAEVRETAAIANNVAAIRGEWEGTAETTRQIAEERRREGVVLGPSGEVVAGAKGRGGGGGFTTGGRPLTNAGPITNVAGQRQQARRAQRTGRPEGYVGILPRSAGEAAVTATGGAYSSTGGRAFSAADIRAALVELGLPPNDLNVRIYAQLLNEGVSPITADDIAERVGWMLAGQSVIGRFSVPQAGGRGSGVGGGGAAATTAAGGGSSGASSRSGGAIVPGFGTTPPIAPSGGSGKAWGDVVTRGEIEMVRRLDRVVTELGALRQSFDRGIPGDVMRRASR